MNRAYKVVALLSALVIFTLAGFIGGYGVAKYTGVDVNVNTSLGSAADPKTAGERVDYVGDLLGKEALDPPSEASATAGAVQGLLEATGDKYATYFDAKHYSYFSEDMAGEFGGIGVLLGEKDGTAYVVEVYKDTPASEAGLKSGDIFKTIAGVTRAKWETDEVVKRVRGKEGTDVEITLIRPGKDGKPDKSYTRTLTRAMIQYPNVEGALKPGNVGYIRMGQFNDHATEDMSQQITELTDKGAKSLVIDLRDNPGGSLDQAVTVASLFLDGGVVVRIDERGKPEQVLTTKGHKLTDLPVVLLVNENSASASEIVAGALKDYGRATVVGVKTFGKGSVQTVRELPFGGAIKFTIAHYLTPKKIVIDKKGVKPDVVVKMSVDDQAEASTDVQMKRALEIAKKAQ